MNLSAVLLSGLIFGIALVAGGCQREPPSEPVVQFDDSELRQAISRSDDYSQFPIQLEATARRLVREGHCTVNDFSEMGGWVRSPSRPDGWYFTYCGGLSRSDRIYLDLASETVYLDGTEPELNPESDQPQSDSEDSR